MPHSQRAKVIIAGGGPAAIEAALVLRRLAGDLVETTVLTPETECVHLPMTVLVPFARSGSERHPLDALLSSAGAELRPGALASVDPGSAVIRTRDGETLGYDALLVAVGGVQRPLYRHALTFGMAGAEDRMHGLIQDLEAGYVRRIAFVVPPGATWPLPLYELALMTAERAYETCAHAELTFVTPEDSALAMFGDDASRDVAELLERAGVQLRTRTRARVPAHGVVELSPGGDRLVVERVVTLPTVAGPRIAGLPHDDAGFVPVDEHARVPGVPGVYAAGDVTDFRIKQGGIACQQADAAAEAIAAQAGARIEPAPFRPVLQAVLLTERVARWLERDLGASGGGSSTAAGPPESVSWTKITGRELSRHLEAITAKVRL
jgi:sulfide:quinone oxidoreductase